MQHIGPVQRRVGVGDSVLTGWRGLVHDIASQPQSATDMLVVHSAAEPHLTRCNFSGSLPTPVCRTPRVVTRQVNTHRASIPRETSNVLLYTSTAGVILT